MIHKKQQKNNVKLFHFQNKTHIKNRNKKNAQNVRKYSVVGYVGLEPTTKAL